MLVVFEESSHLFYLEDKQNVLKKQAFGGSHLGAAAAWSQGGS